MEEENITLEIKEKIEQVTEHANWNRYLAITTAFLAVFAALASLQSGTYSNDSILQKNEAILNQNKADDQWTYYDTKSVKVNIDQGFYQQSKDESLKLEIDHYSKQLKAIAAQARKYEQAVKEANQKSEQLFSKHHKEAYAVTFFQIAIALSAMSALLKRKSFWFMSLALSLIGLGFFAYGLVS